MIRSKQMDELRRLDASLRSLGTATKPSLERHVMIAITSGEIPKLKAVSAISATARQKIIAGCYRSDRSLSFGDVFASCNGYEDEMKEFTAYEKTRAAALARYAKDADKIMLKAMDEDADAEVVSDELHEAAERAGLKTLKAPAFDTTAGND